MERREEAQHPRVRRLRHVGPHEGGPACGEQVEARAEGRGDRLRVLPRSGPGPAPAAASPPTGSRARAPHRGRRAARARAIPGPSWRTCGPARPAPVARCTGTQARRAGACRRARPGRGGGSGRGRRRSAG